MGKEIILPWKCTTAKKAITPIGIGLTAIGIICWVLFFSQGHVPTPNLPNLILFLGMLLCTASGLGTILFDCVENDRFPSFKCKSDNTSQKESTK